MRPLHLDRRNSIGRGSSFGLDTNAYVGPGTDFCRITDGVRVIITCHDERTVSGVPLCLSLMATYPRSTGVVRGCGRVQVMFGMRCLALGYRIGIR